MKKKYFDGFGLFINLLCNAYGHLCRFLIFVRALYSSFLQELTIVGFNVYRYHEHFATSLDELSELCRSGKLHPYEHVIEGFENMPKALIDQLDGKSQGKVIVRV
jgi:NADPH-dependent curcumin reductase CurA